VKQLILNGADI